MPPPHTRRAFLQRSLALAGSALIWGVTETRPKAPGAPPASARKPRQAVYELHLSTLRDPDQDGKLQAHVLEDALLVALTIQGGEDYPLDAIAAVFPDDPPVAILVDAASGRPETTAVVAMRLAASLAEGRSRPGEIGILDARDEDLTAGGYRIARGDSGTACFGTEPEGYGGKVSLGSGDGFALSRALDPAKRRLCVVGRLHRRGTSMGPFVIDAALRAVDPASRKRAQKDARFAARMLASPELGGRMGFVFGDLASIDLDDAASPQAEGAFAADSLLAGPGLFAVERIGHRILANTCRARGLPPVPEPPILAAAAALGLPGATPATIRWTKVSL